MSFTGKSFKRVRSENLEEFLKAANVSEHIAQMLLSSDAVFSFSRDGDGPFTLNLHFGDKTMTSTFNLGEEHEAQRRDGSKVRITYVLESDNVLKQTIRGADGKITHLRREFGEKDAKITISMEGVDATTSVFYELVQQ